MSAAIILIFVIFVVLISILQVRSQKQKITEKVHSIGGQVISIESKSFSTGPFLRVRRGRTVYKFDYGKGNEIIEGWVMFGDLFGPCWEL